MEPIDDEHRAWIRAKDDEEERRLTGEAAMSLDLAAIRELFHSNRQAGGTAIALSQDKADALLAHVDELRAMLKRLEWSAGINDDRCPLCYGWKTHEPDCDLGKLLKEPA